mmetsp:Transcript_18105/g.39862  ORF Transcript_18105/g.39862 Transcript_18105/m.39862 type:complete len:667 (-) Transcript_18105:888-2888(-)
MLDVPSKIHFDLHFLCTSEVSRREPQSGFLWAQLPSSISILIDADDSSGRPPMPSCDHPIHTERLLAVMQQDSDIHRIHLVGTEVGHGVNRIHWGNSIIQLHLSGCRLGNLPNENVTGIELFRFDASLHLPRLHFSFTELLVAVPSAVGQIDQRHLFLIHVGLKPLPDPTSLYDPDQQLAIGQVVASQRHDPLGFNAKVLDHQHDCPVIAPLREVVGHRWGLLAVPAQGLDAVAPRQDHQHRQARIREIEVRRTAVLRDVVLEEAVGLHVSESDLPRRCPILQDEQRDVTHIHIILHAEFFHKVPEQLFAAHFVDLLERNKAVIPEASHGGEVSLVHQFDLDLRLLFHLFSAPLLGQSDVSITAIHHPGIDLLWIRLPQNFASRILPDVHQHVRVVAARGRAARLGVAVAQLCGAAIEVVPDWQIAASIVVLNRSIFTARRDRLIIKLKPPSVRVGLNVSIVVPTVHVTVVDHHSKKIILACIRSEGAQIQFPGKFEPRVQLHHVHLFEVKVKTLQLQIQQGRKPQEADPLLRALLSMPFRFVGIVTLQGLLRGEIVQRFVDVLHLLTSFALDVQLNIIEGFVPPGRIVHINALDVIFHLTFKQSLDGPVRRGALHTLLHSVAENPIEFLRIMLREGIGGVPPEGLHQFSAIHSLVRSLELVEHIL